MSFSDKSMERSRAVEKSRYLSREACEAIFTRVLALTKGGGETQVRIDSEWTGGLRWARNRITSAVDMTDQEVYVSRTIRGASAMASTNKLDDAALSIAIEGAERTLLYYTENPDSSPLPGAQPYLHPDLWSDATYTLDAEQRSRVGYELVHPMVQAKLFSAGYLQAGVRTRSVFTTSGMSAYYRSTASRYSVTVRNPAETGSGWAGVDMQDWTRLDVAAITERARAKCVNSADPKAVEPGRYTLIMEPQAVHDLMINAIYVMDRYSAENFQTVYTLRPGQSKIGLKVFDDRITIRTDPMDPECGYIPFDLNGYPYRPVKWVENGILKELAYNRSYALSQLGSGDPLPNPFSYRIDGGSTSIDEMVATTKRGFLVTRLGSIHVTHWDSLLTTGVTRDGLWLIENGKIISSVKNFRFTESPMFAFNNIVQIGTPQRVLATYPTIVPPIKVDDFNFTSLSDAV